MAKLCGLGYDVVAASRDSAVNTLTGEGLAEALKGASVVVGHVEEDRRGLELSAGAICGALATFGLLVSPGILKSTSEASLQSRPIAGRSAGSARAPAIAGSAEVIESHSVGRSARAPVPDPESPNMQLTVPGHPELTLQLD